MQGNTIQEILDQLPQGVVVEGALFPEPVEVALATPMGESIKLMARGLESNQFYQPILDLSQLAQLAVSPSCEPFDGDPREFRLGIEAKRLELAHEYDPYFSLTIARIDPLPHQLDAVYNYFLKQPRIRFLLADDPGAGKTIMAGLLLKELKQRGLVERTLIVTPANLTFQWQRELKDKFRESFEVIRGDILRANYGSNPWQERSQVVTSVSWVSRIEDAKDSLLRSHWDLIIVDEAHKMSAYNPEKKTLAYQLGEHLSELTDHYLLMTATPHKGDPQNFCMFLELLDKDVYGDIRSLEEAIQRNNAPFYLRRTKEALVTFPDPETGKPKKLFTQRRVQTIEFQIDADELEFYDALTAYVEEQSIAASADNSARGRALGFTMAMLQRRFASSVYAVRRSLERMADKREKILRDPDAYRQSQIERKLPDDFEELTEEEQAKIYQDLESVVASIDPQDLQDEIVALKKLVRLARELEAREIESKLVKLRETITDRGVFGDRQTKLLIFTEHKDTLDYLVQKLQEWGLSVTQIHGGMKIGDRDTPGTRIYAERAFREEAQVLVATEAAGEGINLQFCWFAINYDIPWNPVRLEQRMGRIHRYGQEKDCLILNFVATNTRERIRDWMPRLTSEGVVGADAIFACLGPALEIFSRYSRVEKASGEQVTLREYLEYVWAAVSKEALSTIFAGADASDFEPDARLTAMWLWTLSTEPSSDSADTDDDAPAQASSGYTLEFDAARKIAQGLGAHLEQLKTLVEIQSNQARLLPVEERAPALFGKADLSASSSRQRKTRAKTQQLSLFEVAEDLDETASWGDTEGAQLGATNLDRLHQSMVLFAAGRSQALKRFLVDEGVGQDTRFWTLANALSALYPATSTEKRWVDGILARKKGLGF